MNVKNVHAVNGIGAVEIAPLQQIGQLERMINYGSYFNLLELAMSLSARRGKSADSGSPNQAATMVQQHSDHPASDEDSAVRRRACGNLGRSELSNARLTIWSWPTIATANGLRVQSSERGGRPPVPDLAGNSATTARKPPS